MDFSHNPISRFDRQLCEPSFQELRLADAISANSPYRVFQTLNALAVAFSNQPFTFALADQLRYDLYPFLTDIAAGHDRILPVFLPTDTGFLKVKVESASTTPTVSLELAASSSYCWYFRRHTLITGLAVPLIFIDPPQYSYTPTHCPASIAASSPVDSLPFHNLTRFTVTDPEWDAALAAGPTRLEQFTVRAIQAGSAHGLFAVLQHIALTLFPNCSPLDTLDADLERLTSCLHAIHHALVTNTHVRIDLPGCSADLDLCCLTLNNTPHIRMSVRTIPYPNRVGYSWEATLSELPFPLPCLPDGTLAPIPPKLHERAVSFTTDARLPISTDHVVQLLALSEDECLLRLAIDEVVAYHRHAPHSTDTELVQALFALVLQESVKLHDILKEEA